MAVDLEDIITSESRLWVFGYGSILWKTGFKYKSRRRGYINGFARRFWQGNTTHRGTPESPGRVATLIESQDQNSRVWGMAYELVGCKMILKALDHLGIRECALGGYCHMLVSFCCAAGCSHDCDMCSGVCDKCSANCDTCRSSNIPALVFTATPDNDLYLGPASHKEMADQIIASKGQAGHNVEYVIRLAEYIRKNFKEDQDDHLFNLENQIRSLLQQQNICVECLIKSYHKGQEESTMKQKEQRRSSSLKQMLAGICIKCSTS